MPIDQRAFYNNLRPEEPLPPGDPRWVDLSSTAGDLLNPLKQRIEWDDQFTCQLVTGFIGTGKSTELMRLAAQLKERRFEAVYTRAEPLSQDFAPTDVGDVLAYLAFALHQAGLGRGLLRNLLTQASDLLKFRDRDSRDRTLRWTRQSEVGLGPTSSARRARARVGPPADGVPGKSAGGADR